MRTAHQCERRPVTAARRETETPTSPRMPQANGLVKQLEGARSRVTQAEASGCWQAARQARRNANHLRRALRPPRVDGGAAVLEAVRAIQINAIVRWAERGGR